MNLGGHGKFIYVNSRGARGHEKFIPVWIKRTRWRPKNKKKGLQFKNFHKFWSSSQKFCDFSRILKCRTKKKRSSSQKFYEIRCESTKIMKIRAVNTNLGVLGLDLLSNSPEPVNFFGAQSSLRGAQFSFGGAQAVIWGGTAPECPPPRGAGPGSFKLTWTFSEFKN